MRVLRIVGGVKDRLFAALVIVAVTGASLLSSGIVRGSVPFMAAGAAVSAVSPWGVAVTWLIRRRRQWK
jgi:uncharacterized membrane protein